MTIHSFCHHVLKRYGSLINLEKDFDVLEDFATKAFLSRETHLAIKSALHENIPCVLDFLKKYGIGLLFQTVERLLKEKIDLESLDENHNFFEFLQWCHRLKEDLLKKRIESQTLSFDDLEVLTQKLFQDFPSVLGALQETYEHILVDEFQDVSPRQFQIIKDLFQPLQNTLFIVGDPKQSIYLFRKAESRLFLEMIKLIEKNGGTALYLTETFRTPVTVQNYFNTVFKEVFSEQGPHLFQDATTSQEKPTAAIYTLEQLQEIPKLILKLLSQGADPSEIAILSRTRKRFSEIEKVLNAHHIPTTAENKRPHFWEDLISLFFHIFSYLAGQKNKVTLMGILRNPKFHFSEKFLETLLQHDPKTIFETPSSSLKNFQEEKKSFLILTEKMIRWKNISDYLPASMLFKLIFRELRPFFTPLTAQDVFLFGEFSRLLNSWRSQGFEKLKDILPLLQKWEEADSDFQPLRTGEKGVKLFTIHGAKGLEFEHVILLPATPKPHSSGTFLSDEENGFLFRDSDFENIQGLKPNFKDSEFFLEKNEKEKQDRRFELQRLVYVALTRTRHNLFLFPPAPSQKFREQLKKNPKDSSGITTYNNWLCWLACQDGVQPIQNFFRQTYLEKIPPEKQIVSKDIVISTPTSSKPLLTVTEIETFFDCPKKFDLKYNHNMSPLTLKESRQTTPLRAQERGNLLHEILQFYDPERDNLETVVEQALFNQRFVDPNKEFFEFTQNLITKFSSNPKIAKELFEPKDHFQEFEFTLGLKNLFLSGKIDKLVKKNNQWKVIDYKTHRIRSEKHSKLLAEKFRFQMLGYALAVQKKFSQDNVDTMIFFTDLGEFKRFQFSKKDLEGFETHLNDLTKDLLDAVKTNTYPLTANPKNCENCLYYESNFCGVRGL